MYPRPPGKASHTATLAAEYARQGKDRVTGLRQRAKEKALMRELGLSEAEAQPVTDGEDDAEEVGRHTDKVPARIPQSHVTSWRDRLGMAQDRYQLPC